jgi:hypothetical protein
MAGVSVFPFPLAACGNTNANYKPEKKGKKERLFPFPFFCRGKRPQLIFYRLKNQARLLWVLPFSNRLPGVISRFSMHGIRGTKTIIAWRLVMQ